MRSSPSPELTFGLSLGPDDDGSGVGGVGAALVEGSGHVACRTCIAHVLLQRARAGTALRHELVGRHPVPVPRVRRAVPLEVGRGATDGHIHGDGSVAVGVLAGREAGVGGCGGGDGCYVRCGWALACLLCIRVPACLLCIRALACLLCIMALTCLLCIMALACLLCIRALAYLLCIRIPACLLCTRALVCLLCTRALACLLCIIRLSLGECVWCLSAFTGRVCLVPPHRGGIRSSNQKSMGQRGQNVGHR